VLRKEGADIFNPTNNISIYKKCDIVRDIMCFILNDIIARQKFPAHSIYLSFSESNYR